MPGFFHACPIEGADHGSPLHEPRQDHEARTLAHIVGVGLEGDAEYRDGLALDAAAAGFGDLVHHPDLAGVVAALHRFHDCAGAARFLGDAGKGRCVLGEAGAAETGARMQEVAPDAAVEADPLGDILDVGAKPLAEVRDLIDEGDLGREKAVGGVLDQLRRLEGGEQHRRLDEEERPVERPHDCLRPLGLDPDDDPVGAHEVADGRTLAQEFRVRDDVERGIGPPLPDDAGDLAPGADWHRRFRGDDGMAFQRIGDLAGRFMDEGKVRVAVAAPARGADRQHHHVRPRHGVGDVAGEGEPPGCYIGGEQRLQPRLVDRAPPRLQRRDLLRCGIDAGHSEAELGETGGRYKADISGTYHCDAHGGAPL